MKYLQIIILGLSFKTTFGQTNSLIRLQEVPKYILTTIVEDYSFKYVLDSVIVSENKYDLFYNLYGEIYNLSFMIKDSNLYIDEYQFLLYKNLECSIYNENKLSFVLNEIKLKDRFIKKIKFTSSNTGVYNDKYLKQKSNDFWFTLSLLEIDETSTRIIRYEKWIKIEDINYDIDYRTYLQFVSDEVSTSVKKFGIPFVKRRREIYFSTNDNKMLANSIISKIQFIFDYNR